MFSIMIAMQQKGDQTEEEMPERDLEVGHEIEVGQDLHLEMDNATI